MLLRQALERYFDFPGLDANWRTEILAGLTTFLTMAYIIFVNPAILSKTGMPIAAVTAATCLCAAFGSILMGFLARYPLALAPGMGLNAYFTYTVCLKMHIPWQTALGAVFLSGVVFLLLTFGGIRQLLVEAIPRELHASVAGGVGLFIAFIGLMESGIIVRDPDTTVALGNLRAPGTALALFGLLLIGVLQILRVRASILIGIAGTLLTGYVFGQVHLASQPFSFKAITSTAFHLDIPGALHTGALEIIFVFLFVDLFDNVGTLVAVTKKAGLITDDAKIPRLSRIFFADATATIAGSLAGTSTVCSYIESSAGVAAGGRTGIPAIVTGLCFFVSMFVAPLVGAIPSSATAPALIIVGALMLGSIAEVNWSEPTVAIPAFLTLVMIPLTYSIANGLGIGITSFALLRLFSGQSSRKDWLLFVLAALFVARFLFLSHH
ncbi:NCS2 family permease [Terriglobus roseus]|uniref:Putative MFS transporter, AGZA family, xanthine/uracil permease n=1 Tax=Terriglobus roseus TaxID=392734 RepID=A0A1G7IW66_9BACT|nr:NCS2 family permease [Terriglobus roseus]SDF16893.1 putative MFS transporter, AGZA family, xanthine/uracil permease [Terriglobus roseus]